MFCPSVKAVPPSAASEMLKSAAGTTVGVGTAFTTTVSVDVLLLGLLSPGAPTVVEVLSDGIAAATRVPEKVNAGRHKPVATGYVPL